MRLSVLSSFILFNFHVCMWTNAYKKDFKCITNLNDFYEFIYLNEGVQS